MPESSNTFDLVEMHRQFLLPKPRSCDGCSGRLDEVIPVISANQIAGTSSDMTVEPLDPSRWLGTARVIAVVESDRDLRYTPFDQPEMKRHSYPVTPDRLAEVVGRVYRYPRGFLTGDAREVVDILRHIPREKQA